MVKNNAMIQSQATSISNLDNQVGQLANGLKKSTSRKPSKWYQNPKEEREGILGSNYSSKWKGLRDTNRCWKKSKSVHFNPWKIGENAKGNGLESKKKSKILVLKFLHLCRRKVCSKTNCHDHFLSNFKTSNRIFNSNEFLMLLRRSISTFH